jgi:acylphosphatase
MASMLRPAHPLLTILSLVLSMPCCYTFLCFFLSITCIMPRIAFTVRGHVQGVGFRYTTRRIAQDLSLTGWVRNTSSGTVEGEAQHSHQATLDGFVRKLEASPAGRVEQVKVSSIEEQRSENGFDMYV